MQRIDKGRVKWLRFTDSLGYMRLGSTKAVHSWLEFLRSDSEKYKSIYRVFHTRHLMVVWEQEGKAK